MHRRKTKTSFEHNFIPTTSSTSTNHMINGSPTKLVYNKNTYTQKLSPNQQNSDSTDAKGRITPLPHPKYDTNYALHKAISPKPLLLDRRSTTIWIPKKRTFYDQTTIKLSHNQQTKALEFEFESRKLKTNYPLMQISESPPYLPYRSMLANTLNGATNNPHPLLLDCDSTVI